MLFPGRGIPLQINKQVYQVKLLGLRCGGKAEVICCVLHLGSGQASLFVCFIPILLLRESEKATVALYFGRIRTRLGVVHFQVFRLLL